MISREERKLALFIQTHQIKRELDDLVNSLKRQDYKDLQLCTSAGHIPHVDLKDLIANFNSKDK